MKRLSWALAGIAIVAIVAAACSGSGGGGLIGVGSQQYQTGYIRATLRTLPLKQRHHIDQMVARALRGRHVKPQFLPDSTSEVDFILESVDGNSVSDSPFNFSLYPSESCVSSPSPLPSGQSPTPSPNGFNCTAVSSAPAAADQFDIVACSGVVDGCLTDQSAVILSESYTVINVPPGGTASAQFSLNPVVGGLAWAASTPWANGSTAPTWNSYYSSYQCGEPSVVRSGGNRPHHNAYSSCYDPILDGSVSSSYPSLDATPQYDTLVLNVLDSEGDIIIPASGGGSQYGYPVFLGPTGAVDNITVTCSDPHVQFLNADPASLPDPSPVAQADYSNGFLSQPSITSPVTGHDGATGRDFSNTQVTVEGNNLSYINFDGGTANYTANQSESCSASDSAGVVETPVPYYVGVGQGSITWTGNARHLGGHHHR